MDTKKTILIVEDEKSLSKALSDKFSNEGFNIVSVENGESFLSYLEKDQPNFVILDLVMPGMGGMAALKKMKEDENTKDIPVLVLTNMSDIEEISEAVKNGAFGYIIKSDNTLEDIVEKVKTMLG